MPNLTMQEQLEQMKSWGDVSVVVINGNWWCYFRLKQKPYQLDVDGERRDGWTVDEAVQDCYQKVLTLINKVYYESNHSGQQAHALEVIPPDSRGRVKKFFQRG